MNSSNICIKSVQSLYAIRVSLSTSMYIFKKSDYKSNKSGSRLEIKSQGNTLTCDINIRVSINQPG